MFRNADFWPRWVGGKEFEGATRHCWDLSGGVALGWVDDSGFGRGLDFDYDHENAELRLFFMAQGSYQLHSICFHVMSIVLLLLYKGWGGGRRLVRRQRPVPGTAGVNEDIDPVLSATPGRAFDSVDPHRGSLRVLIPAAFGGSLYIHPGGIQRVPAAAADVRQRS